MTTGKYFLKLTLATFFLASPIQANTDDAQVIVDELQTLVEKSRKERAADRWLQNALEELVAKYNFPWRDRLLNDDFSDGDYKKGVVWSVNSGEFWVDRRLGLRSKVEESPAIEPQEKPEPQSNQDLGMAIFGAILKETLGVDNSSSPEGSDTTETAVTPASIRTEVAIPTTFAVESSFSQNNRPGEAGQYEWIVMQDETGNNAYKLIVTTGNQARLDVLRNRDGRSSYLESIELAKLNEGGEHTVSWRQKSDGVIDVFLDGDRVIAAKDKPFRYGFKYFAMINRSGDFAISNVEILGGKQ